SGGEQGLLSLAFDPDYGTNHLFYVDYTDTNGATRVVEYEAGGPTPVRRRGRRVQSRGARPGGAPGAALRRPAVRKPQRRPARIRPGRPLVRRHGRRRRRRRSGGAGGESGRAAGQAAFARRRPGRARVGLDDRGLRASQSVALLVRP